MVVICSCPAQGLEKAIEDALIELYGKPTVVVRGPDADVELPASNGRKAILIEGAMVTYAFEGDRTATFFETKKGEVKAFIFQCASAMKDEEIKDLRRFASYDIGDASIKTNVTPDRRRFEALSSRYLHEE